MYDILTIQTSFRKLIGWRGSFDTDMPVINSDLKTTNSGLYFEDAHPLVTLENIDATFQNIDGNMYGVYVAGTSYAIGAMIRYNLITYIGLTAANQGHTPNTSTTNWQPLINSMLQNLCDTATVNMLNRFINDRQLQGANKALIDSLNLFDGDGSPQNMIINEARFVGFEFKVRNYVGLAASIKRISLQFTQIQPTLRIYLFHSSQQTAIKTFDITTTKVNSSEWFVPVDFDINFSKYSKNDTGGRWYLGYFETAATGQAINRNIDFVNAPCGDCYKDQYNRYSWDLRNRYLTISPCCFKSADLNGINLPTLTGVGYMSNINFGMNINIAVRCDLTDFFVDNMATFTRVLWKQVAYDVIRTIAFSTRVDGVKNELKQDAYAELKGDPTKGFSNGIEHELDKEYKAINFAIEDLNSPCMGKPVSRGLTVGAI